MKRIIVFLLVVAVVTAWAPLWAQERGAFGRGMPKLPPGKWWENPRVVERVQLTAEQQQKIADLVYQHAVRMIDLKARVERSELELTDLVDRSELNADRVRAAFASFQGARQALETERFEMLLGVRQLLSPQQWQELQKMHREGRGGRVERGGPHRPPRGGQASEPPAQ